MAHPRMYREDDPYLNELREVCRALPEAVEVEARGPRDFDAAPVDWGEVAELVEESYRQIAAERMLMALDKQTS